MYDLRYMTHFWSRPGRIETLRDGVKAILEHTDSSYSLFADRLIAEWCERVGANPNSFKMSARLVSRFVVMDTNVRSVEHRTAMLMTGAEWGKVLIDKVGRSDSHETHRREIAALVEMGAIFSVGLRDDVDPSGSDPKGAVSAGAEGLQLAIELIVRLMGLSKGDFSLPELKFFEADELATGKSETHFICYRYDAVTPNIVKSFCSIHRPDGNSPVCRYGQYYQTQFGRKRISNGIILAFHGVVAFVGSVDNGEAIEVFVFRKQRFAQKIYDGLMLTISDEGGPVATRLVLVRTKIENDEDAGTGVFSVGEIRDEAGPYLERVRNRIHFTLEDEVLFEGKPISQRDIVSLVARLIQGEEGPILRFSGGDPFNPASSDHYTFNSALGISRADEISRAV